MAVRGITKRWLLNSMSIVVLVLIAFAAALSIMVRSYYYNGVRQSVNTRISQISALIDLYSDDSTAEFENELRTMVEKFEDKDLMELMLIDKNGDVAVTSSGFEPEDMQMDDYELAVKSEYGHGEYIGKYNNERIMAVSSLITQYTDTQYAAYRIMVSMSEVDMQISYIVFMIAVIALAITLFIAVTSALFIGSIVKPIREVGRTTKKIAQGNFSVRIEKSRDDELGDLADSINNMAEELAESEKLKNDFISSVSHELRTPLTAIKGWGETLKDDNGHDPELLNKGIGVIITESERLSQMVEELLDFSRMQSGRFSINKEKTDLIAELGETVLMFTQRAAHENISLIYDEPDIYPVILGDKNRLRQVFTNIIDNAIKYSDKGGTITIKADLSNNGKNVIVSVADNGRGISKNDLPKVKEKFFKADFSRRGSGIGLAVADEIVRMHGGILNIESEEGVGTTVTMIFPVENQ